MKIDARFDIKDKDLVELKGCFFAGSIMPDIGNFPG